jgi:hypothetical protein
MMEIGKIIRKTDRETIDIMLNKVTVVHGRMIWDMEVDSLDLTEMALTMVLGIRIELRERVI